jgi:hypothetical protein
MQEREGTMEEFLDFILLFKHFFLDNREHHTSSRENSYYINTTQTLFSYHQFIPLRTGAHLLQPAVQYPHQFLSHINLHHPKQPSPSPTKPIHHVPRKTHHIPSLRLHPQTPRFLHSCPQSQYKSRMGCCTCMF